MIKHPHVKQRMLSATAVQWIKFSIAALFCIAFAVWVSNYALLLLLVLFFDIYIVNYIPWGFWRNWKPSAGRKAMEWLDAILYALIAVYFINTFFFQNYKIPTSSLEKSLLVGDYLFVSKLSYGPRVPNTPLSFPLAQHTLPIVDTKSYLEWIQWPYKRLKGLGEVERNDIVVFNFPAGDTVALRVQNPDYYTLVDYGGRAEVNGNKQVYGEVVYRPVDRRENYVKRVIGMPGDRFQVRDNQVYINGKPIENPKYMQQNYYVMTNGVKLGEQNFRELGVSVDDRVLINNEPQSDPMLTYLGFERNAMGDFYPVYRLPLTQESLDKLKSYPFVSTVIREPGEFGGKVYPLDLQAGWTRSDYGPIWIPRRGATLALTLNNLPIYERVIRNYEGNTLAVKEGKIFINGKEAPTYTFKMNYYFMLGDNRDNSADSRMWGFVPEDHVVGSPVFVWLSIDKDRDWFDGRIRFNRLFRSVESLSK